MKNSQRYSPKLRCAIAEIEGDNVHGAGYLALKCLDLLADAATDHVKERRTEDTLEEFLKTLAGRLAAGQSAMCIIENLLAEVLGKIYSESGGPKHAPTKNAALLKKIAIDERKRLELQLETIGEKGAIFIREKYPPGSRIVTISHSRAVLEVLRRLAGHGVKISVAESRPLNEGVEMARRLAKSGLEVRLVPDCLLGLETTEADIALIGADSITPGGNVVNKAGSRLLALASKADGVPVYCCAETIKVMAAEPGAGTRFPIQKLRPNSEISDQLPDQVEALNLYFDLTESELIEGYLTERGFLTREQLGAISKEMAWIIEKNLRWETK
jgi:translation initiation factor 2B subunit (eIF-2B alpha/beta/delta family)